MKVSVAMITYNHERFIAQAIESVLMQETSFDYELVIGEDCSTDRTREIVVDFQRRFPERIRLLLRDQNVGAHENFAQTLAAGTGEYVALLEGDDYWTSPHKIQKQAEFLDSHSECSICFHPVRFFWEGSETGGGVWPEETKEFSTIEDIIQTMFICTPSVMLRNGLIAEYPVWFSTLVMGDWPLFILYASHGKIGCINEVMSAYRKHSGGIWNSIDDASRCEQVIQMYGRVNAHFNNKYAKVIRPILAEHYFRLGSLHDENGRPTLAKKSIGLGLIAQIRNGEKPRLIELKKIVRLTFPTLYSFSKRVVGNRA